MNYYDFLKAASSGTLQKVHLNGGQTEGHIRAEAINDPPERLHVSSLGSTYAEKYRHQDENDDVEEITTLLKEQGLGVDNLTSIGSMPNINRDLHQPLTYVYKNYSFGDNEGNKNLQIHAYKNTIISLVESNPVIIIKGPTGCGKSTQVPQFILDSSREVNIHCSIVVTQPRRIAAKSLAKRVCQERKWQMGTIVGYQVGMEKQLSTDTRLLYCTAGTLLQKIIAQRSLNDFTHIIIDEIHERDSETDFLLVVLKKMMRNPNNRIKLILMSATILTDKFVDYFSKKYEDITIEPIVTEISTSQNYAINYYYLDSLICRLPMKVQMDFTTDEPQLSESMYVLAAVLIGIFKSIDQNEHNDVPFIGSVLVFLPGILEIENMHKVLTERMNSGVAKEKWMLCPLHSSVTFDEQMRVFSNPPAGTRKIILATNIAESSITVPDVKYIIDFCLCKIQVLERNTSYSSLALQWISQSQGVQRAGRVGRVMAGRVYRLVPEKFFNELPEDQIPEILRCPLDTLVLKAKMLNMDEPVGILGRCMDPPDLSNIHLTILKLKEAGALKMLADGKYSDEDGDLTFIGRVMATLPLDINLSKLIILGYLFGCLEDSVIMACSMNVKNFFATPFKKRLEAYLSKLSWADASCSDPMTYLNTYHLWKHKSLQGWFKRSGGVSEEDWTARRFVQVKSLREVQRLEQEIMQRLRGLGIGDDEGGHSFTSIPGTTEESRPLLLKIALAGAAYPNYFLQGTCEEKDAVRVLGGRDPFSSVYLSKWPVNQPGPLYMNTIKKYFEECGSQITVSFDGSAKVYVKFGSSASAHDENKKAVIMPGRVTLPVYRALKLRHMQIPIKVPILPPDVANERAKKVFGDVINKSLVCWSNGQVNQRVKPRRSLLPGIQASVMTVLVTHIDDPSSFWVQIVDDAFMNKQNWITNKLNCEPLKPLRGSKDLSVGQLVVAPFNEQGSRVYHRARVVALKFDHESKVLVQYIDYGNTEPVPLSHLYDFNDELVNCGVRDEPALAIHCYLAEIQPSMNQSENATWSSSAISAFRKHFYSIKAIVSIYSVVNEIVAVHLFNEDTRIDEKGQVDRELSFNFFLIRNKLAEPVDEPFLSRENHISREAALKRSETSPAIDALTTDSDEYFADFDFSSPTESECHNRCITLQGPRSPLEVNLICLTKKCMGKEARIEGNSVNSVLLDNFPMDHHARLVVAQIVTQVNNSDRLTLRETTVMPQIHGLLGLVSMIFAPRVELRSDPERKYVTGALCGLGFDSETNASYFPENDMDIEFDTQFDLFDMINVNKIRYWINKSIGNEGLSTPTIGTAPVIATARSKIVSHLLDLLQKKRESLEPSRCEKPYRWNCINAQYHMPPYGNDPNAHEISESDYTMSTYPLIWGIELNEGSEMTRVNAMRRNLIRLDNLANGRERLSQPVKCELCQMFLENLQSLRFHLTTTVHRFNLMNFEKHFPKKSSKARK